MSRAAEMTISCSNLNQIWSGIGVKIKVAFHFTGLPFYAVLFQFNVASVAFSFSVAN